jgi:hypothetical protein
MGEQTIYSRFFYPVYFPGGHYWFYAGGAFDDNYKTIKDGKWGLVRKTSAKNEFEVVVEPVFDWHGMFSENLAAVLVDGKWGFIDTTGDFVIQPRFEDRGENQLSWNRLNSTSGLRTRSLHSLYWFYFFENGQTWVCENGRCGIIDTTGNYILKPQYEMDSYMYNGTLTWFKQNGKFGILNMMGSVVVSAEHDSIGPFMLFSNRWIWVEYGGKWALMDYHGKMHIKPLYSVVRSYPTHTWIAYNGRWGLVDSSGTVIIDPFIDSIEFGGKYMPVKQNGKWGYLVRGMFRDRPLSNYLSVDSEKTDSSIQYDDAAYQLSVLLLSGISEIYGDLDNGITGIGRIQFVRWSNKITKKQNVPYSMITEIQNVLNQQGIALNSCYARRLKQDSTLSGILTFEIHINTERKAEKIFLSENTVDHEVGRCVMKKIKELKYPKLKQPMVIKLPLAFTK